MTLNLELPSGPFASKDVSPAVGIKATTVSTWGERGYFAAFDHPDAGKGRTRFFSLLDVLTLALMGQCNAAAMNLPELPSEQLRRWASNWLTTLHASRRVTHLHVRYYGKPGADDSRTRITPNDDVLSEPIDHGTPRLHIAFDLDAIFVPAITALRDVT